jgi:hypothetical protein
MQWLNRQTDISGKWSLSCSGLGEMARYGDVVAASQGGGRCVVDLQIARGDTEAQDGPCSKDNLGRGAVGRLLQHPDNSQGD